MRAYTKEKLESNRERSRVRNQKYRDSQKVPGVNWKKSRGRWEAGTEATGFLGTYIKKVDAEEAMRLGKKTDKSTQTSSVKKPIEHDAGYCETKQRYLSSGWLLTSLTEAE